MSAALSTRSGGRWHAIGIDVPKDYGFWCASPRQVKGRVEDALSVAVLASDAAVVNAVRKCLASEMPGVTVAVVNGERDARRHGVVIVKDPGARDRRGQGQGIVSHPCAIYIEVKDDWRVAWLLEQGAQDAVVAGSVAFSARLRSAVRRARSTGNRRFIVGDIILDGETRRIWCW